MAKRISKIQTTVEAAPQTRDEVCADRFEYLDLIVAEEIKYCRKQIADFAEKVVADPLYTLRWGDNVIAHAAKLQVYLEVELILNKRKELLADFEHPYNEKSVSEQYDQIRNDIVQRILRKAAEFPSSTSQMANLTENREREAWAQLLSFFGGLFPALTETK